MFPESVHQKLKQLINSNQEIIDAIKSESKNRPARELKSIAESQGWWLDRTPGDHKIYKHDEYFEHPNYSGYITIDDCNDNLSARQVRGELQKIFTPKQKKLIQEFIVEPEIRSTLRKWLTFNVEVAEAPELQTLVNEIENLRQQLYIRNQEIHFLTHSISLDTIQNNVEDQQTLEAILNENQQLIDQKNDEINQLFADLAQKENELTVSGNEIKSLQAEKRNLFAELAQFQEQQQHLVELEQELADLQQQIQNLQPFRQQVQQLQRQLTQAEIQRQNQVAALNQDRQQLIQQYQALQRQLETQIATLNSQIQQLDAQNHQLQAWGKELQQNLNQATLNQAQLVRTSRRSIQKTLWISSAIAAVIVAFNPGPRWINAVAVAAIPTATMALQKRG
ncbi:hypothetical protein RIF25_06335 [Thermosynechococcaceae cyanobacterium BACA0444]|uniref:Uncharacterized protein n=1 Tax=Pseudocalidococcus azoricus BACA0444 TaxID=2918990 RepID=A0AAE4FRM3_9CYAN|nr:hypothetical protein [Pseudocalidococcus azoricus]MDS3860424.1 hypothetical protein [Pseudocalidococcus azoricus BACA0444]